MIVNRRRPIEHFTTTRNRSRPILRTGQRSREFVKPVDELSDHARKVLGPHAMRRFEEFRALPPNWNFGRGKPLSPASVATLELFLATFSDFATQPSLFLTEAGNLELAWEEGEGNRVELEFFPNRFEYFFESGDKEGGVPVSKLPVLIAYLASLRA